MRTEHAIDWSRTAQEIQDGYEAVCKQRDELLEMLERCIPHINPKVADKSLFSVKPMSECYLNTLAVQLVEKIKG